MKGCIFLITLCSLLLFGSQLSRAQQDEEDCPLHELDVDCVNPCNTCEHQKKTCPRTEECVPGCDCKPGFLRNKFGYCIPKRFCGAPELPASKTEEEPGDEEVGNRGSCLDATCNSSCLVRNFTLGYCSEKYCICSSGNHVVETDKKEVAESGGCPNERICTQSCERRGFRSSICLGPGRGFCNCYTPVKLQPDVEPSGNREVAESGGCPSERICTQSCARRNFKSGICLGPGRGFCNCYTPLKLQTEIEPSGNREVADSGGCPSERICTQSCARRNFKSGICLGPGRGFCNCYTSVKLQTKDGTSGNREVAESGGCPSERVCTRSCERRRFTSGICLGPGRGFCNCYTPVKLGNGGETPENREVADSGGCPNARACTSSCERRGFKTGLCLGPGLSSCNCYTSMQVPAEGSSSVNGEVADSGGCPSTLRCMKSCNRRNFETGVCQGPRRAFCTCYSKSPKPKSS